MIFEEGDGCGYTLEKIDFLRKGSLNLAFEVMVPLKC